MNGKEKYFKTYWKKKRIKVSGSADWMGPSSWHKTGYPNITCYLALREKEEFYCHPDDKIKSSCIEREKQTIQAYLWHLHRNCECQEILEDNKWYQWKYIHQAAVGVYSQWYNTYLPSWKKKLLKCGFCETKIKNSRMGMYDKILTVTLN